ncbi:MAG: VIT domain-containing protein [Planctomycetes bacterium]|nr:VIT domain-containing protein [Planctomycetota bacterium]
MSKYFLRSSILTLIALAAISALFTQCKGYDGLKGNQPQAERADASSSVAPDPSASSSAPMSPEFESRAPGDFANAGAFHEAESKDLDILEGEELLFIPRDALENSNLAESTDRPKVTSGNLFAKNEEGETIAEFPLKHTDVQGFVSGPLAAVSVKQQYVNDFRFPIEAVYVFPLSNSAAINEFIMHIGERRIHGIVKEREEARRMYEEARAQGYTASLLEQERPNIFTQSVANIPPLQEVIVEIRYVERLVYDHGEYRFHFPMVVGPRYISPNYHPEAMPVAIRDDNSPRGETGGNDVLAGGREPTSRVPDADRITPPIMPPGMRSANEVSLSLEIDAGLPIQKFECKSHLIEATHEDGSPTMSVRLANREGVVANSDFDFLFVTAQPEAEASMLTYKGDEGSFFMITIEPPVEISGDVAVGREMIFVLDCSGSMEGAPLEKSKEAVRHALDEMNPQDTFNIIRFSDGADGFRNRPVPNSRENRVAAGRYLSRLEGLGGTEMIEGIKAALDFPHDSAKMRIVCFFTDGYIGNDNEILGAIDARLGDTRLFSFGIGSSVNRYLLDEMANVGRGSVTYVRPDEPSESAVNRFYEKIHSPVLYKVEVDFRGIGGATDVYPSRIPDLFVGQPIVITGRAENLGVTRNPPQLTISGQMRGERWSRRVEINETGDARAHAIAYIWARDKIADLSTQLTKNQFAQRYGRQAPVESSLLIEEITKTALDFQIVSQFTSFVAIDSEGGRQDMPSTRIDQPVEMPEGVTYEGHGVPGVPNDGAMTLDATRLGLTLEQQSSSEVVITGIDPQGAAAAAGLRVGDTVTEIGNRRVTGLTDVRDVHNNLQPGEVVPVRVSREGSVRSADLNAR